MSWFNFGKKEVKSEVSSKYLEKCLKRVEESANIEKTLAGYGLMFKISQEFIVSKYLAAFNGVEVPLTSLELAELYQVVLKKYQEQDANKSKAILEEF